MVKLPGKRPVGALPKEEVEQLPRRAQDYIALLEKKFNLNTMIMEKRGQRIDIMNDAIERWRKVR